MPLTPAQEQYLKNKNIGGGMGTAGAIGGAAKGASAGLREVTSRAGSPSG